MAHDFRRRAAIVGTLSLVFVERRMTAASANSNYNAPQHPVRTMVINVLQEQRTAFYAAMSSFSKKYGFSFDLGIRNPSGTLVMVQMLSTDFEILVNTPFDELTYNLSIYGRDGRSVTEESVNNLLIHLKADMSNIPGLRFVGSDSARSL